MFSTNFYSLTAAFAALSPVLATSCGECWVPDDAGTGCKVDPTKVTLTCDGTKMNLAVDKCVMGNTTHDLLRLTDNNANAGCTMTATTGLTESTTQYLAEVTLDCSSNSIVSVTDDAGDGTTVDKIKFAQQMTAVLPADANTLISFSNTNVVDFSCVYDTDYEISDDFEVQASVSASQAVSTDADFPFELKWYTDSNFNTLLADATALAVGSRGYFAMEVPSMPSGFEFNTYTCEVQHKTETEKKHKIVEDNCTDDLTEASIDGSQYSTSRNLFSYKVFEFRNAASNEMTMSCNVKVCQSSDTDNACRQECVDTACITSLLPVCESNCGWSKLAGSTEWADYYRSDSNMGPEEAATFCGENGTTLMHFKTLAEYTQIYGADDILESKEGWVDGVREGQTTNFFAVDGTAVGNNNGGYAPWRTEFGMPRAYDAEHSTRNYIWIGRSGLLNDAKDTGSKKAFCRRPKVCVP